MAKDLYKTVQAPPTRHSITTLSIANMWGNVPSSARQPGIATPFAAAGKVVANGTVGLGAPETVTVAAEGFVVVVPFAVLPIENLGDAPNMLPDVEFKKMI